MAIVNVCVVVAVVVVVVVIVADAAAAATAGATKSLLELAAPVSVYCDMVR